VPWPTSPPGSALEVSLAASRPCDSRASPAASGRRIRDVRAPLLAQPAQRLQFWLFALTLFFLPFELPIAQGLHGELFQTVGAALPFFFVGPVALYLAIALTTTRTPAAGVLRSEGLRDYALVGFLFVAVGVYACLTTF